MYVCMYVCMCVFVFMLLMICVCVCVCLHIYIYICVCVCIHVNDNHHKTPYVLLKCSFPIVDRRYVQMSFSLEKTRALKAVPFQGSGGGTLFIY